MRVTDVYLSKKIGRTSTIPFALVRFAKKDEALKAVTNLNEMEIRENIITIK